jgi:cytochrome c peroxidase
MGAPYRIALIAGTALAGVCATALVATFARPVGAQEAPEPLPPLPESLKKVPVPEPRNLREFVRSKSAAIQLGKALFWDAQVGSEGRQSCASCHFHAGADDRLRNQTSPGLLAGDTTFQTKRPNGALAASDFPLRKLANADDRASAVLRDSDDVISSQGVVARAFVDVVPGQPVDTGTHRDDPVFHVNGFETRRVEPRNTPTVINAVFNFRNFWDGRANHVFNGVSPFGAVDPNANVFKDGGDGTLAAVVVAIDSASLASQAVGPPLNPFEMSFDGRTWPKVGKKLLALRPLALQLVHADDSVLGVLASSRLNASGKGLETTYARLIQAAFRPEWWRSSKVVTFSAGGPVIGAPPKDRALTTSEYTQMEANFSLFFGLSVMLYESTLVSADSPFDRWRDGDPHALTDRQKKGLEVFMNKGKCVNCHGGAEFTNASVRNVVNERLERMIMGDGRVAVYDNGFYNIGVRPTQEDVGVGGNDPFGNPFAETRRAQLGIRTFGDFRLDPPLHPNERVAVNGAFKTPGLRNVELTGPYFHNGGQATLRQVVDFYNRGADFADRNQADLDPDIQRLNLDEGEKVALVDFLTALTDERVKYRRAPFDHPQLLVPDGHDGDETTTTDDGCGASSDRMREVAAVGAQGGPPLKPFLDLDPQSP